MGVFKGKKKILASPCYRHIIAHRSAYSYWWRFCRSTIYLHPLLTREEAQRLLGHPDNRRGVVGVLFHF